MLLKFADAARAARVDPATISRAVKTGIISVSLDNHGKRRIDFAELIRVYPNAKQPDPNTNKADSTDLSLHNENESLKIQIEAMKSIISAKDELVDALKVQLSSLQNHVDFLKNQLIQANTIREGLEQKLLVLPISTKRAPQKRDSQGRFCSPQKNKGNQE